MPYATVTDLVDRFGHGEMASLTDREGSGDNIIDAVAEKVLSDASGVVDSYIGSRYEVPLKSPSEALKRYTCDIARSYLYDEHETEGVKRLVEQAFDWLQGVASGKVSIPGNVELRPEAVSSATAGKPVIVSSPQRFDRSKTGGGF